jgi:hypothetical protein
VRAVLKETQRGKGVPWQRLGLIQFPRGDCHGFSTITPLPSPSFFSFRRVIVVAVAAVVGIKSEKVRVLDHHWCRKVILDADFARRARIRCIVKV